MTTFVDVGGHLGETIDIILKEKPNWKIISFEPAPVLYNILAEKYKYNSNIKIIQEALYNTNKKRSLYISVDTFGNSLHKEKKNLINPTRVKIQCIKATDFIKHLKGKIILYLNCEGAEFEILEDLIESGVWKKISFMLIEFHHQPHKLDCEERYNKLIKKIQEIGINYKEGNINTGIDYKRLFGGVSYEQDSI